MFSDRRYVSLRAQDEDAVVPKFVVLDDGERLEGFPEPDAVGDDAPAEPAELVYGSHDTITLELEELFFHTAVLRMPVADFTTCSSSSSSPCVRNR